MANQSKFSKWKRILTEQKNETPETLPTSKYSGQLKLQETTVIAKQLPTDEERAKEEAAVKSIGKELEQIQTLYGRLQSDFNRISVDLRQSEVELAALKCILKYLILGEETDRVFRRKVIDLINYPDRIEGLTRPMIADMIQQKINKNNSKSKLN